MTVTLENISKIMTVLPPKEGFSPDCVGAIGLLVYRLATSQDLIVGQALDRLPFDGVNYLEISNKWYSGIFKNQSYQMGVACLIQKYQPSLIEIHNRPEIALYLSQKFPQIPISLTLHNDPLSMRGLKMNKERQKFLKNIHVVAVSEWIKDRFLSDHVTGNITILPNHIHLDNLPEYIPIKERDKTILFVGRVVADKGADLFISICQKLLQLDPTWNVEIIGADRFTSNSPQTGFIKQLSEQAQKIGIKMTGYLPHAQVLQKISCASAVIMPSRWPEPFGMTALEAMACGTPLLVSDRGALPKVVGKGAVLIDPENIDGAFDILIKLLQDAEARQQLSEQAMKQAALYNTTNALQKLNKFRQQICPALRVGVNE